MLDAEIDYTAKDDGTLTVSVRASRRDGLPDLPRAGLIFGLPRDFILLRIFGGTAERYPDKRLASVLSQYVTTVGGNKSAACIRPQESGAAEVRAANVSAGGMMLPIALNGKLDPPDDAASVTVFSDKPFYFNAERWTPETLTGVPYDWQLPEPDGTYVTVDGAMAGIGSNSCGPELDPKYRVPKEVEFEVTFVIK